MKKIIDRIKSGDFERDDLIAVLSNKNADDDSYLFSLADSVRREKYGRDVYIRGLIEISNYCKNNCLYCGIRRDNRGAERYRLSEEEILFCADEGYELGFRTFVLQGGEDNHFTDDVICSLIEKIKGKYPDVAITLSLGERGRESFERLKKAGADRYLLRHETADETHYGKLHPVEMKYETRMKSLYDLKDIGFQVGAGCMVGSPFQTVENLADDLMFFKKFQPQMVGIGPFIPSSNTPFENESQGTLRDTLCMVSLTRLILPSALIPSTTALGTISPDGREMGLKAGANVVMPNLSPKKFRKLYSIYDNKIGTGSESAEGLKILKEQVERAGYQIVVARGDFKE